jgi:hypothetical protein
VFEICGGFNFLFLGDSICHSSFVQNVKRLAGIISSLCCQWNKHKLASSAKALFYKINSMQNNLHRL